MGNSSDCNTSSSSNFSNCDTSNLSSTGYSSFSDAGGGGENNTKGGDLHIYDNVVNLDTKLLVEEYNNDHSSNGINTIKGKILKEKEKNPKILDDIKLIYGLNLDAFAVALGNEKVFKETFLLPRYKPNKIMEDLNKQMLELQELRDLGDCMTEEQLIKSIETLNERKKNLCESKLELILTECSASDCNFLLKKIINKCYDFGVLHSAISLDGTIIEWGRGPCGKSLVCPTLDVKKFLFAFEIKGKEDSNFFQMIWNKIKEAGAFILDLFTGGAYGSWSLGKANDTKLDKIAKICVLFNKNKYYNPLDSNCQHFVKMILKAIESDFSFDGEFGKIIKKLENEGKIDFCFKEKTFNTRKELDMYVKSIDFSSLCLNDKKLLICYKNTFDLYLRNEKDNEKFQTTKEDEEFWRDLITREKENLSI